MKVIVSIGLQGFRPLSIRRTTSSHSAICGLKTLGVEHWAQYLSVGEVPGTQELLGITKLYLSMWKCVNSDAAFVESLFPLVCKVISVPRWTNQSSCCRTEWLVVEPWDKCSKTSQALSIANKPYRAPHLAKPNYPGIAGTQCIPVEWSHQYWTTLIFSLSWTGVHFLVKMAYVWAYVFIRYFRRFFPKYDQFSPYSYLKLRYFFVYFLTGGILLQCHVGFCYTTRRVSRDYTSVSLVLSLSPPLSQPWVITEPQAGLPFEVIVLFF